MTTMTPMLQSVVSDFSECERSDIARLLIHANDLYQMYNNVDTPDTDRQASLDHALTLISQIVESDPDNTPAMNLLGRIELDRGNLKSADVLFTQCLQHSPENTQYLCNKGYLHLIAEEPEQALQYFNKALSIDTRLENAFLGIARAHQALRNYDIAYLHYRSLVNYGHCNETILQGMLNCCANIQVESYKPELEADLLSLFSHQGLAHERLGQFAAALIVEKYDLENPNAPVDIASVASDPLIYHSLMKCSLANPFIDEFVTLLRQSILFEVMQTSQLRDELQLLAIAIGTYAERSNYALIHNDEESNSIQHFNQMLSEAFQDPWNIENIAGALIVTGMYQSFFAQPYAVNLTALKPDSWPTALEPLMQSSLYRRAEREAFKQQFPEKKDELTIAKSDLPSPFPRWNNIDFFNQQSLRQELSSSFNSDFTPPPERLLLLVAGDDAAQKAFGYAQHFNDVDVVAVEHNLENLAEGHLKAQEASLNNIVFWPFSLAKRFLQDGNPVHFASISSDTRNIDQSFISLIKDVLATNGVLNIKLKKTLDTATLDIQTLVKKESLRDTSGNIRALRSTILADKYSEYWANLINNEYFYSIDGCRQAWFADNKSSAALDSIIELLEEPEWRLAKVLNHHRKTVALPLAEKHLLKFNQEQTVHNDYSVYMVKEK